MKVCIIGSGGREHAIAQKLAESPHRPELWAVPGNAGIAQIARCVPLQATDVEGVVALSLAEKFDLVVVTPDDPLAIGMVDALKAAGIRAFGPNKAAARIESSKAFAKELMHKYGIPTAGCEIFSDYEKAKAYVLAAEIPLVVKADGLALGKGVLICSTREEAQSALKTIMIERAFGDAGNTVVIEEYISGPEVSVLAFVSGETLKPMVSAQDHKRALDGDKGLNTGGMGCFAPSPKYTKEIADIVEKTIMRPTLKAMISEGCPFSGVLYFGLMLTGDGPKVLEYNARFGDPETQVILPLMRTDLLDVLIAVADGKLAEQPVEFMEASAVCVVLASGGYPEQYETGFAIEGLSGVSKEIRAYHAGTKLEGGAYKTAGGRVLGVTGLGRDIAAAREKVYAAIEGITFKGMHCRLDIGIK